MPRPILSLLLLILSLPALTLAQTTQPAPPKINVLILTGGHGFDKKTFPALFAGYNDINPTILADKIADKAFDSIDPFPYHAIVLYNYKRTISPDQQANLLKLLDRGIGLVVFHHAIAAYTAWPEFPKIAGLTYHETPWTKDGKPQPRLGYKHDVTFKVHIADPDHPITRGLSDYTITDETYNNMDIDPSVHPLLTTDEPTSDKLIAWTKTYAHAKIVTLQHGHDAKSWTNPALRTLLPQSIRYVAHP